MTLRLPWPRHLSGRAVLVLLAAVVLVHLGSLVIHQEQAAETASVVTFSQVAGRLVTAARAIGELEPSRRDAAAHAMSSDMLALHWEAVAAVPPSTEPDALHRLREQLIGLAHGLGQYDLRLGYAGGERGDARQALLGTVAFPDGSFLNFSAHPGTMAALQGHAALVSTSLIAMAVGGFAILLMRNLTSPLRRLATAADAIGRGPPVMLAEAGPDEIQHVARAFNAMQNRIHRLIADRTQALAAVSHDLRTPLTRLRLRAGFVADAEAQRAIDADLDEMDAMIEATLHYLRAGTEGGEPKRTDIAALVATVVDDAADAGHSASFVGPRHLSLPFRALPVKRALSNLVGNAVAYGGGARVSLSPVPGGVQVRVEDDGPGIPEADLDRVFEPFERLDSSRNRATGGVGLGLAIARQAIEREGGTVQLQNRAEGGLAAEVFLPDRSETRHALSQA